MSASDLTAIVESSNGFLRGRRIDSVRGGSYFSFQGIPYGKPPVGDLRFKAPVPAEPWTGVRDALVEGPVAPSYNMMTKKICENNSEDCLFLNVYTTKIPQNASDSLMAVMFWIHGGGFNSGSGNSDLYGPDYLVTEEVVVVTCNYRLGPLGFLSLQTPECPGNNGLKDIILALKWCRENISKFGGDPEKVTIFGCSAGGAAVHYLSLSEKAKGLFRHAIAQSGVAFNSWALARRPRESAFKLAEAMGFQTGDDGRLLEFLRKADAESFVRKGRKIMREVEPNEYYVENVFTPCVEPETEEAVITVDPEEMYRKGDVKPIPFMLGANTLEGLIMRNFSGNSSRDILNLDTDLEKLIPKNLNVKFGSEQAEEIKRKIRNYYFAGGFNEKAYTNVLSRIYFLNGINQTIEYHRNISREPDSTFVYRFTYSGSIPCLKHVLGFQNWEGTCHGDELSYLFRQNLFDFVIRPGTKDFAAMETLTKIWTDFAKNGNPGKSWAPVSKKSLPYMEIGHVLTPKNDLEREEFDFWKEICSIACRGRTGCKL